VPVLGIDTSDKFISVGLWGDDKIINSFASDPELRNKNELHNMIDKLMSESKISFDDLKGVAVAIGPGSFTGLRVGLAAAKAICWSLNLPLAGVSSLRAIAQTDSSGSPKLLAIKEARRGEYYIAGYQPTETGYDIVIPESVVTQDDMISHLNNQFKMIGPGTKSLISILSDALRSKIIPFNPDTVGGVIAQIGSKMINSGEIIDVSSAIPEYIRYPEIGGK
jgi:tRNA threonylcarbamoyladenosine biosynthesis protein TsaB